MSYVINHLTCNTLYYVSDHVNFKELIINGSVAIVISPGTWVLAVFERSGTAESGGCIPKTTNRDITIGYLEPYEFLTGTTRN